MLVWQVATLVMDGIPAGGFLCFLIMSEWSMNKYMPVFSLESILFIFFLSYPAQISLWPLHFPETSQYRCIPYDLLFRRLPKIFKYD